MTRWPKAFATACVFLTRIPMPRMAEVTPEDEGRALLCFPLTGFLIGGLLWLVGCFAVPVFGTLVTAALLLVGWAMVTGGLHLDGLADSADGWLGGYGDPERTLAIMRDSRSGAGALVAVGCLLILKFAALTVVVGHGLWVAVVIAPVIGRCTGPLLFIRGNPFYTPYVKPTGIARHFIDHCPAYAPLVSFLSMGVCALLLDAPGPALALLATCALVLLWLRRMMLQRLGGATGDTAGAATEILETVVLLASGVLLTP